MGRGFGISGESNKAFTDSGEPIDAPGNRRIIKTARTVKAINAAAQKGLAPLVRAVTPSSDICDMVAVFQDPASGEIELSRDVRSPPRGMMVMDYTTYYPYYFPNPFAAYLLPPDLAMGEEVWLEDLIENLVAVWGNQGYRPRLSAAAAIWNGTDFDVQWDPGRDAQLWIG